MGSGLGFGHFELLFRGHDKGSVAVLLLLSVSATRPLDERGNQNVVIGEVLGPGRRFVAGRWEPSAKTKAFVPLG